MATKTKSAKKPNKEKEIDYSKPPVIKGKSRKFEIVRIPYERMGSSKRKTYKKTAKTLIEALLKVFDVEDLFYFLPDVEDEILDIELEKDVTLSDDEKENFLMHFYSSPKKEKELCGEFNMDGGDGIIVYEKVGKTSKLLIDNVGDEDDDDDEEDDW